MAGTQKVATVGIATSFSWMDKVSGQRKEKTEFHNVVAWGKLAEICEQYVKKGSKIYIEGRLQTRDWEGEDGVKRYKTEIVMENMIMLDKKGAPMGGAPAQGGDEEFTPSFQAPRAARSVKPAKEEAKEEEVSIDDLPF